MSFSIRRVVPSVACLGVFALLTGAAFAQSDPQVGVWKLNIAKSKYSPGPASKSATTRIEAAGAGTKVIVDQEMPDGTKRHWEFTANYDGKDSPVTGKNQIWIWSRARASMRRQCRPFRRKLAR